MLSLLLLFLLIGFSSSGPRPIAAMGAPPCQFWSGLIAISPVCALHYSLEICPALGELSGNITTSSNGTVALFNYANYTNCWRRAHAFVTLTSDDTKTSVVDFVRVYNSTSGGLTMSGRGFFTTYLAQQYFLRLYAGLDSSGVRELFAFPIVAVPPSNMTTLHPAWVRFNRTSWIRTDPRDDSGYAWTWYPDLSLTTLDLTKAIQRSNLTDLVLIGSSRMRTLYYDLIKQFAPQDEFQAEKLHGSMDHHVAQLNLTIHFSFFDCKRDVLKGTSVLPNYENNIKYLKILFREKSLCSYNQNCEHHRRSEASSSSPVQPPFGFHPKRQAIVFSTAICEAHLSKTHHFRKAIPRFLEFLNGECNLSRPHCQDSTLLIKSEESVDPRHTYWNSLNDNRRVLQQLAHHRNLPYFDSFRITRMWKIFNDSYDGTHFYSLERKYVGNIASTTTANLMADFVFQILDAQQHGPNKYSTPTLLESFPTATTTNVSSSQRISISLQSLPYTSTVNSCKDDGKVIAQSTKRNNPELFFVLNSSKHSFPSWDAFQALKLDFGETRYLDKKEFEAFPLGAAMPQF